MGALLGMFLTPVLQWLSGWADSWIVKEKAEQDAWGFKTVQAKLESIAAGQAVEVTIKKEVEAIKPITSASGWNNLATAALLLLAFSMCGCCRVAYQASYIPVGPEIARPVLETKDPFTPREVVLATYAHQVETAYAGMRKHAMESNAKNGYTQAPQK